MVPSIAGERLNPTTAIRPCIQFNNKSRQGCCRNKVQVGGHGEAVLDICSFPSTPDRKAMRFMPDLKVRRLEGGLN